MDSRWFIIIAFVIFWQDCDSKKQSSEEEDKSPTASFPRMPKSPEEVQKAFANFFNPSSSVGNNAFYHQFFEVGRKAFKFPKVGKDDDDKDGGGDEDSKDADLGGKKKKRKKDKPSLPLAATTFAFYGKIYGCQKSKVYRAFLIDYNDGTTEVPDNHMDDKWLKDIASKADEIDTEEVSGVTEKEVQDKMLALDNSQKQTLNDGESQMPLPAAVFIHFIKILGCHDSNEPKYQDFKKRYKVEINKIKRAIETGKPEPKDAVYLSKADSIIHDIHGGYE